MKGCVSMPDAGVIDVLARASREIDPGSWNFIGFNWPMLVSRVARRAGTPFVEVFEAGVALSAAPRLLPSSTTDFHAYPDETCWRGSSRDVMAMTRRMDAVWLDASSVDLAGHVNTFGAGPVVRPTLRSAGGGGSADVAARARVLRLINMSRQTDRLQAQVEHVTARPQAGADVRLFCRGGVVELGDSPKLTEIFDSPDGERLERRLVQLGVDTSLASRSAPATRSETEDSIQVLQEAAARGYRSAERALSSPKKDDI
jgi:acyl CoA:acetate/3-ketoacid CoA transferase beta subunit